MDGLHRRVGSMEAEARVMAYLPTTCIIEVMQVVIRTRHTPIDPTNPIVFIGYLKYTIEKLLIIYY